MELRKVTPSLARREVALDPRQGHLTYLDAGQIRLMGTEREIHGGTLLWQPEGRGGAVQIEAASRAQRLSLTRLDLAAIEGRGSPGLLMGPLSGLELVVALPPERREWVLGLFAEIDDDLSQPRADSQPRCEAVCTLLLTTFLRLVRPDASPAGPHLPLAERFMFLAMQHLHDHWEVKDYAAALGVTRFQLGDAMRAHQGRTPQAYLQEQVVQQAMILLRQPQHRVAAVAYRLGFQDPAYFSRYFKRAVGQSPGAWRDSQSASASSNFASWP